MDAQKLAVVMMFAGLGVTLTILLAAIAMNSARSAVANERGVSIVEAILRAIEGPIGPRPVVPTYTPFKPGECAADAQRYYEEHGYVPAKAEPSKAPESARHARRGRPCSPEGSSLDAETTLPSRKLVDDGDRAAVLSTWSDEAPHGQRGGRR